MSRPAPRKARRGTMRGSPMFRLRIGFVLIAMVLSLFGARLVQLQGVDPRSYAAMAAAEGTVEVELPAERGDILDRNAEPLADSVDGVMVAAVAVESGKAIADPFRATAAVVALLRLRAQALRVSAPRPRRIFGRFARGTA